MKLYEAPRNSKIRILNKNINIPINFMSIEEEEELILNFHHIDGMYSLCTTEDGQIVHPAAWTEVEVLSKMSNLMRRSND